jgi:hypothetical protein
LPKLQSDIGKGSDKVATQNVVNLSDGAHHKTIWKITKFKDEDGVIDRLVKGGMKLEDVIRSFPERFIGVSKFEGNVCLNTGIQGFEKLIAGLTSPPTAWNNANAYLGCGDSNAAEAATQTDLQAATNYAYVGMVGGYPSQSTQALSWQASFGSAVANWHWYEYVVSNASTKGSGVCLNRKMSDQGTKTSGQTWVLTLTITWS